jgi:hypothetical protein
MAVSDPSRQWWEDLIGRTTASHIWGTAPANWGGLLVVETQTIHIFFCSFFFGNLASVLLALHSPIF